MIGINNPSHILESLKDHHLYSVLLCVCRRNEVLERYYFTSSIRQHSPFPPLCFFHTIDNSNLHHHDDPPCRHCSPYIAFCKSTHSLEQRVLQKPSFSMSPSKFMFYCFVAMPPHALCMVTDVRPSNTRFLARLL